MMRFVNGLFSFLVAANRPNRGPRSPDRDMREGARRDDNHREYGWRNAL